MRCKNEVRRDGSQFYASVHRFRNRQSQAWLKLAEVFTPVIETELDEMEVYNTVLRIEFSALRSAFKSQNDFRERIKAKGEETDERRE